MDFDNGDIEGAENIIKKNKDEINQTGFFGETYLMAACKPGNTVVINWLIDARTDLDTRDIFGHTALHYYVIGRIHKIPMVTHFCPCPIPLDTQTLFTSSRITSALM
ncbi:putative ankyrin repeat protein RF_0381 [Octopus sinensis]|uniref:Ankyrin repeat protein RF_0381 n=1 Tax=Octopus sinensis TaxID=2607531 RepID=A0A6P7TMZ4_9MOLL|nr:putative ankyrin repeat protein RF_0381 [Octopus sinensis]